MSKFIQNLRVTLIGSGNVATILGKKISKAGHTIHQVFSRNIDHARAIASEWNAPATSDPLQISHSADLYIIAIADDALHHVPEWLHLSDQLVVHTAGSVPLRVLENVSSRHGILYPLQTLRKELKEPAVPLLVDGNTPGVKEQLFVFAAGLSDTVDYANDEERSKLHLAAVIANNFSNFLFSLAEEYCRSEKVNFKMILPLLHETVNRLEVSAAADVQTGPAARNDEKTIARHLSMLSDYPQLKDIYGRMTEEIRSQK